MENEFTDIFGGRAAMPRLIDESVKIIQINSVYPPGAKYPIVMGLGSDRCVYCWNSLDNEWEVFITKQDS